MRIISHILIVAFIVSIYVSYCQWQSSYYYTLAATTERQQDWPRTILFAGKSAKAYPLDDLPFHTLGRALLEQGHLQVGIAITKKALTVRPHKKYLLYNLKKGREALKAKEKATNESKRNQEKEALP